MAAPLISVSVCERLIEAASRPCPAPVEVSPVSGAPEPEWDALANSFASLGSAFAWGALVFALIALLGGVTWGYLVREQAKEEAKRCAEEAVREWLEKQAPALVRQQVDWIRDTSIGAGDDAKAADDIGKEAGP